MSDKRQRRTTVTLGDVARAANAELSGDAGAVVADVTHDSRQVRQGWLFVAIRGAKVDAHEYLSQVVESGAAGVVSERERPSDFDKAWLRVDDARRAMALAAAEVHGHPSRELNLVGITGTNGKTTTAYLVATIAGGTGTPAALLSTVEYRIGGDVRKAAHTTPEATDAQRFLRRAVDAGCRVAVMESSSQALDLRRCDALRYAVAVYTNLTRDHLDYHGTMDAYFASKRRLFDGSLGEPPRASVVNIDDARGVQLARELKAAGQRVLTYALDAEADVNALDLRFDLEGMRFRLRTPGGEHAISSPLIGRPHAYNLLAATATCLALGFDAGAIAASAKRGECAPGRFERVAHAGDFAVVVDYAHTDDALASVLRTARDVVAAGGRIITVFGCGGDRDKTKRAPMGEAAARLSDVVILTSDNPRTENPEAIFADVEAGMPAASHLTIADRRAAIHHAIAGARSGDIVLIAGKGHEDYQIIGTEKIHFDDREVAREALAARGL